MVERLSKTRMRFASSMLSFRREDLPRRPQRRCARRRGCGYGVQRARWRKRQGGRGGTALKVWAKRASGGRGGGADMVVQRSK